MPELLVLETANSPGSSRAELLVFNCHVVTAHSSGSSMSE